MAYKNFFKAKQLRPSNNLREYLGLIGVPRGEMLFSFPGDRKSTRLNSSHDQISYAVFCLKKKKKKPSTSRTENRYAQNSRREGSREMTLPSARIGDDGKIAPLCTACRITRRTITQSVDV